MQLSTLPPDLDRLRAAWERFTTAGELAPWLDPLIALSWQRCAPRLSPAAGPPWSYASPDVLPLTVRQHKALMTLARPIMEDIYQYLEGSDAVLILADVTGCVLDLLGDPAPLAALTALGIRQGV